MKSTTSSKLAEQSFKDYARETVPNDKKNEVAFVFNTYARLIGLPLRMYSGLPSRVAKICRSSVAAFHGTPMKINDKHTCYLSTKNLQEQITDAWGL